MNGFKRSLLIGCAALMAAVQIQAGPVNLSLAEYALNIDGSLSDYLPPTSPPVAPPAGVNVAAFDVTTGLGTVTVRLSGAGQHHVGLFVDHEIDETVNTFFNEQGDVTGSPYAGQSWEIDEPGFRLLNPGDIFGNFGAGALDRSNGVPATAVDDVSMAMAWDFLLGADETATISFLLSETAPTGGFYLTQTDASSQFSLYFSSALVIEQNAQDLPEPSSTALVGLAMLGGWMARRKAAPRRGRSLHLAWACLGLMGAGAGSSAVQAAPPVVKTVPWVAGSPLLPHTTYPGRAVRLKGTAGVQGVSFQYAWDFGDGSTPATGTVTNKDVVEASHVYVGATGQIWTARLTVTNAGTGESASRAYYVQMKDRTLEAEANVALDEGLWYLHKTMNRMSAGCNGLDCGAWNSGGYAASGYHGVTAANANAFMVNGHQEAGPVDNPYTDTVASAMRFLFTQLAARGIGMQADNVNGGAFSPDANGNGLGLFNPQNEAYQSGMLLSAIVASGTPNAIASTGPANVVGRRYLDIVQDMVDNIAFCQYDAALGGGWYYTCNGYNDNSISQWMAIGLLAARQFGAQWPVHGGTPRPDVVPEWNKVWLAYSQVPPNPPAYTNGGGYFGYQSTSPAWGPYATTASGLVQLVMDGIGRRPPGDTAMPSWNGAETFIREHWDDSGSPVNSIKNYYYGLFSFTKAMLLHDPNGSGVPAPIRCLTSSRSGTNKPPIDWYGAEVGKVDTCSGLTPTSDGVARTLIAGQNPSEGYWYGHNNSGDQYPFETAWAIMMLNRTVFESGVPVAVAKLNPNPAVVGQSVTLDGGDSFHQDAARKIVSWQWDLDNDGVWDVAAPVVTRSFPALGSYPVTLKVVDDGVPARTATTLVTVQVSIPPLPPTADANGPYSFCPAVTRWFLDGSGSVNPDEGQHQPGGFPGDTIRSHVWDLDGSGQFVGASGAQPDVKPYFGSRPAGSYLVQLKVTDSTSLAYPSSGLGDLSSVASAIVNVRSAADPRCACVGDLAARAKAGKIQLTWTPVAGAAGYNVYRGTLDGGPYVKIGSTTSTYSTLLDATPKTGTPYYYVVRPTAANADELCQSNQASATAMAR